MLKGERNSEGFYEIEIKDKKVKYPSVTTILALLEDAEVDALKSEMDPKMWEYVSRRGADRGSVMHSYLENYAIALKNKLSTDDALLYTQKKTPMLFKSVDPKFFELGRNFFYNIYNSDFLTEFKEPVQIEGLMISPKYKYAGRTDIVYVDNEGNLVMGDYKTSTKHVSDTQRKLVKYKLQIAAYANAYFEMYGKKPKYGCIWMANPTECQRFIVHENEMDVYLFAFLHLVNKFYENI
jgi:ATP-dependent exoDNAse (exonuclease V) beta subunit